MCTHFSTRLHSWTRKDVDEGVQRPGPTPAKQLVRAAPLPQQSGDDYGRRIYGPRIALVCNEMSYACVTHTTHHTPPPPTLHNPKPTHTYACCGALLIEEFTQLAGVFQRKSGESRREKGEVGENMTRPAQTRLSQARQGRAYANLSQPSPLK